MIPVLNEASRIGEVLACLQAARGRGVEVIVVDGGSWDETRECALTLCDRVLESVPGRAGQMNAGAHLARGQTLFFLHADTLCPTDFDCHIATALNRHGSDWGYFPIDLSGERWAFKLIALMMNLRSTTTRIATGDQGLFVRRRLWERIGGYPQLPLMEDIAVTGILRRFGRPGVADSRLCTSSRRWRDQGVMKTIFLMWWLRAAFFFGADPHRLRRRYYGPGP